MPGAPTLAHSSALIDLIAADGSVSVTLYRAYDEDGRLLYVGITDDWARRSQQHRARSRWTEYATRYTFKRYDSRVEAAVMEKAAIRAEVPVFNMSGRPFHVSVEQVRRYGELHPDDRPMWMPLNLARYHRHKEGAA